MIVPFNDPVLDRLQDEGAELIRTKKRIALNDPTGMGKCKQFIRGVQHVQGVVLIVCKRNMMVTWARQIEQWCETEIGGVLIVEDPKDAQLIAMHRWVIVSYDTIRLHAKHKIKCPTLGHKIPNPKRGQPATKSGVALFNYFVKYGWPKALGVDEHHKIANPDNGYALAIKVMAQKVEYFIPISATPYMNKVPDIWTALNFMYPRRWPSKWAFLKQHANARPSTFGWTYEQRATDPEALATEIADVVIRREKRRYGWDKLPPETIIATPGAVQKQILKTLETDVLAEMPGGEFYLLPNPLVKLTRLRQASVCPKIIDPTAGIGAKIELLTDMMVDFIEEGRKVLVLSCFSSALMEAYKYLANNRMPGALITGDVKQEQRNVFMDKFNNSSVDEMPVAFMTIGDLAEGVTLTSASVVWYLDRHPNPAKNLQAEDRLDRPGQTTDIDIFDCVLDGSSSDELINAIASGKELAASEIYEHIRRKHDRI